MKRTDHQANFSTPAETILKTTGEIVAAMKHDNRIHGSHYYATTELEKMKQLLHMALIGYAGHIDEANKKRIADAYGVVVAEIAKKKREPRRNDESKQRGFYF